MAPRHPGKLFWAPLLAFLGGACLLLGPAPARAAPDCMGCHSDASLRARSGRAIGVNRRSLKAGPHSGLSCVDCHVQPGRYDEAPHFPRYRPVDCSRCHAGATKSLAESFHGEASARGVANAPGCLSCHRSSRDSHGIVKLDAGHAEASCRQCHATEAKVYDTGVHASAASGGKQAAGCVSCHPTHSKAYPPSPAAIQQTCVKCHPDSMKGISSTGHGKHSISCAACHDVHATQKPQKDLNAIQTCVKCHPKVPAQFKGSVHAAVFDGQVDCLACHKAHHLRGKAEAEGFGCGSCHDDAEKAYRKSAHRLARLRGNRVAALCGDCHGGHNVKRAGASGSPVSRKSIPEMCGRCHSDRGVVTSDFVRLPISLPRYHESVHGQGWRQGKSAAVCTDCHGWHDMEVASSPSSSISKQNLAKTCGQCHKREAQQYVDSVHGRAVAHGIHDSPTCTDCHEEHLILPPKDPRSPVHPENLSSRVCAHCHQNPEMAAKYGLPPEVISSYNDSYHGWAIKRGGRAVAVCVDCHGIHSIGSALNPASSIHKSNVVKTCGRCHPKANATFAASYTHVLARGRLMPQDIARIIYLWLLAVVLGGMLLHNLLIYGSDLRRHFRDQRGAPAVQRMNRLDLWLHATLILTFSALAVSGFALRFPGAWWVRGLAELGFSEDLRRLFHRIMAVLLVGASCAHLAQIVASRRGRRFVVAMLPGISDFKDLLATLAHHLGRRREPVSYGAFDYTQKAEYWALIWGTAVMSLTGFVLWFPTHATRHLPAWVVRVCETIHFYEAILAVAAIIIWHFFFVIFRRGTYPMSWTWITGRMPLDEWRHHHGRAAADPAQSELAPPAPDDRP